MKTKNTILTILLMAATLIAAMPATAQKRKQVRKPAAPAQPVVVEETPAQKLFKTMLPATAKVLFVDSMIVDKQAFLKHIPLNRDAGTITTYDDFFGKRAQLELTVFQNEFGDRCYYAEGDTTATALYTIDRLGSQWSKPRQLTELGTDYRQPNYPFLMTDGITLIFAAKGEHSIGGYDLFMTLFDTDSGTFYKPENYGLPFNSTANDYLLAIDEENELGYLVSDRYQPEGKVCIYTFVPQFPRVSLENEDIDNEQLKRLAQLTSISDTWKFGNRDEALQRYRQMLDNNSRKQDADGITFVVNDQLVYHHATDFQAPQAQKLYQQLMPLLASYATDKAAMEAQRGQYANATKRNKQLMTQQMLRLERKIEETYLRIKALEKDIRTTENNYIKAL